MTSLLVLTCVLIAPLVSLLLDLYWLDLARIQQRSTAITQPPSADAISTSHPSATAAQEDLS